jgi:hypothetical protein
MATIVFSDGNELKVVADVDDLLEAVDAALRGGAPVLPDGWIEAMTAQKKERVLIQAARIAYVTA